MQIVAAGDDSVRETLERGGVEPHQRTGRSRDIRLGIVHVVAVRFDHGQRSEVPRSRADICFRPLNGHEEVDDEGRQQPDPDVHVDEFFTAGHVRGQHGPEARENNAWHFLLVQ